MGWGKIGSLCSLKAIALACFLTPTTATILPTTPAYAQFNIVIPGFGGGFRHHGRRYGRRHTRQTRRGGRRGGGGEEPGEVSAAPPSGGSTGSAGVVTPGGTSGSAGAATPSVSTGGKKFRGTTDN